MRPVRARQAHNGAITRGLRAIRASAGDLTPAHLIAAGLTRRQADNAIGYACRIGLLHRVARGVYRRGGIKRAA
jgi:hypothetical protein